MAGQGGATLTTPRHIVTPTHGPTGSRASWWQKVLRGGGARAHTASIHSGGSLFVTPPRQPTYHYISHLERPVVAAELRLERMEERHLLLRRVGRLFAETADEGVLVVPLVQLDPPLRLAPEGGEGEG